MLKLLIKTWFKSLSVSVVLHFFPVSPKWSSCNFSVTPAALLNIVPYQKDKNYILLCMYLYLQLTGDPAYRLLTLTESAHSLPQRCMNGCDIPNVHDKCFLSDSH